MLLISFRSCHFVKFDEFFRLTQSFLLYSSIVFIDERKYEREYDSCEQKFKIICSKQQHLRTCRIKLRKQIRWRLNENILFVNDFAKNDNVVIKIKIKSVENDERINWTFTKQTSDIIDDVKKSFIQQFQSFIVLKADNESFLLKFFYLTWRHLVQPLTTDPLFIFESSLHTSFNAIDQIINNNNDFDLIELKKLKNVYAEIISNLLNKLSQIYVVKKMLFNTTTFI